jgi:hypothetical protein
MMNTIADTTNAVMNADIRVPLMILVTSSRPQKNQIITGTAMLHANNVTFFLLLSVSLTSVL